MRLQCLEPVVPTCHAQSLSNEPQRRAKDLRNADAMPQRLILQPRVRVQLPQRILQGAENQALQEVQARC